MANGDNRVVGDFFNRIMAGKWEEVISNCREHRGNIGLRLTKTDDNVIHLAVNRGEIRWLMELLNIASPDDLERKNKEGDTPLHLAAMRGDRRMCEQLCQSRRTAVTVRNNSGEAPMYLASVMGEMGAFSFLLDECMHLFSEPEPDGNWDQMISIHCIRDDKDTILHAAIRGEFIDLAYKIFIQFRPLAIIKNSAGETPIHLLAKLPYLFKSGYRPGIINLLVYKFIPDNFALKERSERLIEENETRIQNDVPALNEMSESSQTENEATNYIKFMGRKLITLGRVLYSTFKMEKVMEFFLRKSVLKEKRKHVLSYTMVEGIIEYLKEQRGEYHSNPWLRSEDATTNPLEETVANRNTPTDASTGNPSEETNINCNTSEELVANNTLAEIYTDAPIVSAVKMGILEMVSMIVQSFPFTVEEVDRHGKNLIFLAAESRQPQVLRLLLKLNIRQTLVTERLEDGKNVLHVAAELKKDHHPWSITSGAPLQMHLEVKWFELVKALMPSHLQLCEDNKGEKPNEVFMKTHEKLVGEGLEWLSSTARSCTVISSLLTTAALTTATTVPGGVNGDGVPNLKDEWRFKLFSISALVTLCFGVLSLVMFLVILSSRSDAKNFKVGLPRKLIYGLTTLYLSLSTLLLAFCTAQSFAIHGRVRYVAYALYAILSSSIIYLVKEQLPLFFDFIEITLAKLQNWCNN